MIMVAPVTPGRVISWRRRVRNLSGSLVQTWEHDSTGQRQKRPYNLPLTASTLSFGVVHAIKSGNNAGTSANPSRDSGYANTVRHDWLTDVSNAADAGNKAYAKFKDQIYSKSSLGTTLAEGSQSVAMIAKRALQLTEFTRCLRRFDPVGAAKALGNAAVPESLDPRKHGRKAVQKRISRDFGGAWLEYWLGWAPLIGDIGSSVEVLQTDFSPLRISGRGASRVKRTSVTKPNQYTTVSTSDEFTIQVEISADVKISNPNLWLANALGFINPVAIAWELVPFSFIVDWFINVGDFLSSYTDLMGVAVTNASYTRFARSQFKMTTLYSYWDPAFSFNEDVLCKGVRFERALGIGPGPVLKARPPKRLSVSRGATAVSLLIQQLR